MTIHEIRLWAEGILQAKPSTPAWQAVRDAIQHKQPVQPQHIRKAVLGNEPTTTDLDLQIICDIINSKVSS